MENKIHKFNAKYLVIVLKDDDEKDYPYLAYIPAFHKATQGKDERELEKMVDDLMKICLDDYTCKPDYSGKEFTYDEIKNILFEDFGDVVTKEEIEKIYAGVWWYEVSTKLTKER